MTTTEHVRQRITTFIALLALVGTFAGSALAGPGDGNKGKAVDAATWEVFSENLVKALHSDHEGVKLSAVQLVIRYGDQVDVDEAVFDVVRLYRNHQDEHVRRMAVVALGKMQNAWAIDMLTRSERFEKSESIRQTIHAVLAEYQAARANA